MTSWKFRVDDFRRDRLDDYGDLQPTDVTAEGGEVPVIAATGYQNNLMVSYQNTDQDHPVIEQFFYDSNNNRNRVGVLTRFTDASPRLRGISIAQCVYNSRHFTLCSHPDADKSRSVEMWRTDPKPGGVLKVQSVPGHDYGSNMSRMQIAMAGVGKGAHFFEIISESTGRSRIYWRTSHGTGDAGEPVFRDDPVLLSDPASYEKPMSVAVLDRKIYLVYSDGTPKMKIHNGDLWTSPQSIKPLEQVSSWTGSNLAIVGTNLYFFGLADPTDDMLSFVSYDTYAGKWSAITPVKRNYYRSWYAGIIATHMSSIKLFRAYPTSKQG